MSSAALISAILEIPVLGPLISVVIPFVIVLAIVIFVHEFGHYIVGRWCGIAAEEFSLGFGGEVFGWTDSRGTRWRLSWLPLGGYVKFKGDADVASGPDAAAVAELPPEERRNTLQGAPIWARALTVAAGPGANFLLSIVVFAGLALAVGQSSDEPVIAEIDPTGQGAGSGLREGDRIVSVDGEPVERMSSFLRAMFEREGETLPVEVSREGGSETLPITFVRLPQVSGFVPDAPAEQAGIQVGDVVQAIDGQTIASFLDLKRIVEASNECALDFTVERNGEIFVTEVQPRIIERIDPVSGELIRTPMIGVLSDLQIGLASPMEGVGAGQALNLGADATWRIVTGTFSYLGAIFAGAADGSSLGGPIGIARASGFQAQAGLVAFVAFIATVSTAIGLINLFPIPILDGGHLVFYAIEAVRGRPLGERWVDAGMKVGLAAILLLLVFATYNDIARLFVAAPTGC
ncbi:MAG: RIP metalloprotease RseP [Pseudomonadota bacterium]